MSLRASASATSYTRQWPSGLPGSSGATTPGMFHRLSAALSAWASSAFMPSPLPLRASPAWSPDEQWEAQFPGLIGPQPPGLGVAPEPTPAHRPVVTVAFLGGRWQAGDPG